MGVSKCICVLDVYKRQEPICSQLLQDSSDDCRVDIDLDKIVARFVSIFQKMDEEGLKRAVHQLCLTLIPHERRQIVQEVADRCV